MTSKTEKTKNDSRNKVSLIFSNAIKNWDSEVRKQVRNNRYKQTNVVLEYYKKVNKESAEIFSFYSNLGVLDNCNLDFKNQKVVAIFHKFSQLIYYMAGTLVQMNVPVSSKKAFFLKTGRELKEVLTIEKNDTKAIERLSKYLEAFLSNNQASLVS